jgi:hypothetical protein
MFVCLTSPSHSYDAAEDNEITFREGERITEIEPASEDWWQGKNQDGQAGLFPGQFPWYFLQGKMLTSSFATANYVEVQE